MFLLLSLYNSIKTCDIATWVLDHPPLHALSPTHKYGHVPHRHRAEYYSQPPNLTSCIIQQQQ